MSVWFITGTSRGFGATITDAALAAGHQVVATARNVRAITDRFPDAGDRLVAVPVDVTNEAQIADAVDSGLARFGIGHRSRSDQPVRSPCCLRFGRRLGRWRRRLLANRFDRGLGGRLRRRILGPAPIALPQPADHRERGDQTECCRDRQSPVRRAHRAGVCHPTILTLTEKPALDRDLVV
jgi:hypothetical protein